jgi:polysaccharide biosynthesis protein PslH
MTPRALMLTHTAPLPLVSGERIRNFHLLRELARRGWQVSLFSLLHGPAPSPEDEAVLRELCEAVTLEPIDVSTRARARRLTAAIVARRAFHTRYFYSRPAAERLARRLDVDAFDAITAESLYMYPYLPEGLRQTAVLDTLNAEVRRVEGMAAALRRSPRGIVARLQLEPVRRYEAEAARNVARVVAVSEDEARYFRVLAPGKVEVVPNGVDCENVPVRTTTPAEPRLLFVGSMDYSANVDAVEYLIDEILPRVRRTDARIAIVGSNPRPAVRRAAHRSVLAVELLGQVPSTAPHFERSRVLLVPLRFGGGTRLKILEALARGVPVLTTAIGCEGLELTHERDVVVADEPEAFAGWIDRLLEDDALCVRLSAEGRRTVAAHYDWRQLGGAFERVLEQAAAAAVR